MPDTNTSTDITKKAVLMGYDYRCQAGAGASITALKITRINENL